MKRLKIFSLVFSLIFCCFGLTGAVKVENEEDFKTEDFAETEKNCEIVLNYYFKDSGMKCSEFKKQENPLDLEENFEFFKEKNKPTKENVANLLALYLMFSEILNEAEKNKLINKRSIIQLNDNILNNFLFLTRSIGATANVHGLNEKELKWLKRNITKEKLRKVEITEEMLKKVKKKVIKIIEKAKSVFKLEEFKKLPEEVKVKNEKCVFKYLKNLDKIKNFVLNAKLEDVKKAVSKFEECSVRVINVDTSKV